MSGLILTKPNSFGVDSSGTSIQKIIHPSSFELIDSVDLSFCCSVEWYISIEDQITNRCRSLNCHAIYDVDNNDVKHNFSSIIGNKLDVDINVIISTNFDEIILFVENNSANDIKVKTFRFT